MPSFFETSNKCFKPFHVQYSISSCLILDALPLFGWPFTTFPGVYQIYRCTNIHKLVCQSLKFGWWIAPLPRFLPVSQGAGKISAPHKLHIAQQGHAGQAVRHQERRDGGAEKCQQQHGGAVGLGSQGWTLEDPCQQQWLVQVPNKLWIYRRGEL